MVKGVQYRWQSALVLILGALASPTSAQSPPPPDSLRLHQLGRSAQRQFERTRRKYMRWSNPTYGPCDIRIGRYCLSDVDWGADEDWTEPVEDGAVNVARRALLARLDSIAGKIPGDGWIAGQRVRYLVEAQEPQRALRAAAECRAADYWWCLALAGFALYASSDFAGAERAFADALQVMEPERACEWGDLSRILDGGLRGQYRDLACAERDSLQRRILWLADPLYSIEGNELAGEHFARQVHSELVKDAETPEGDTWGRDLHRFVMRYGWTFGWERIRSTTPGTVRPTVRGHFGHGAKYFLPKREFVADPFAIAPGDWDLEPERPQAGHAPPYAASAFSSMAHDVAVFLRGDSVVVAVVFELDHETVPADAVVETTLVGMQHETAPRFVSQDTILGRVGVLAIRIPRAPFVMSLEALAVAERSAARVRYGADPDRLFTYPERREPTAFVAPPAMLSGLLMTRVDSVLPATLDAAIRHARPSHRVRAGERIGLYWELYGAGPAARPIATSLTLSKAGKSFFGRVVGVFGIGSDKPPVSLQWTDVTTPARAFFPRAVAVDLPEHLDEGRYRLTLSVRFEDGTVMTLEKRIEVTD
ncbi:MAG: hypothetical protein O7I93_17920 [Gemmatimonadetes bacterium]|nr:hypothetical protein [Gemmatimonadota bacterium]